MTDKALDKLFITELVNDLYRYRYSVPGGKALDMLHDWSRELREASRTSFPASRLRRVHAKQYGKHNW